MEEWLFFFIVPFACIFVYECTLFYIKNDFLFNSTKYINYALVCLLLILSIIYIDRVYTLVNFLFAIFLLLLHQYYVQPKWLGKFYVGYLFSLIPFIMINGILTYLPVVLYNNNENMGWRFFSIPLEDFIYSFNLLLMNISIYEYQKQRYAKIP